MANMDPTELTNIALELARAVVGRENVDRVEVEPTLSWVGTPAYWFHVLVDPAVSADRRADLIFRLLRGLRDRLDEHGDEHEAFVLPKDSKRARTEASRA